MNRQWGTGAYVGQVVKISNADNQRVGNCWMKNRLRDGDLAIVTAHSGDSFYSYNLLEHEFYLYKNGESKKGYKLADGAKFGAYVLGKEFEFQPNMKEYHLIMAGESVSFSGKDER
jgi:hypothetical protein